MLLSIAFFPPVEWFAVLARCTGGGSLPVVDRGNYEKQSYRNRCSILSESGPLDLRFPVVHNGVRRLDEVLVDYSTPWVQKFKVAVASAYYSSPFFEYYRDELFAILDSHPLTVWELDWKIIDFFCRKMGLPLPLEGSVSPLCSGKDDYRELIHPKKEKIFSVRPYWQVFRDRYGFVGGLSVMDLLFCEGPESICYLL